MLAKAPKIVAKTSKMLAKASSTTHKKNIAGFKPGSQYAIKCAFQGTSSELTFSDTVIIFAQ